MTAPMYVMLAAAVLSALAWRRNATSAALAFSYFASQLWWIIAGTCDVGVMFMIDATTIALVFCKAIVRCPDEDFRTAAEHFRCMVAAFTHGDRLVLAIFPLMWCVYVAQIDEFTRWYALWALAMAQFAAAGADAFMDGRRARVSRSEPDIPSSGLQFAHARVGRWST